MKTPHIERSAAESELMLNRRTYRRTKILRSVVIEPAATARRSRWVFGADHAGPVAGKMVDLGCGGMSAELPLKLDVGTSCHVRIEGTSGKVQRARGTVRNVRGDNGTRTLGIAFTEPLVALGDPGRSGKRVSYEGSEPLALVVDDDPGVRHVLDRFLRGRGLRVTTVPNAEDALDSLRRQEPALMMLDLKMDGMTGVQLLETMNAEGLRVPHVWAMSGSVPDDEALAALTLGAAEFINKPFDLDHLDFSLELLSPLL